MKAKATKTLTILLFGLVLVLAGCGGGGDGGGTTAPDVSNALTAEPIEATNALVGTLAQAGFTLPGSPPGGTPAPQLQAAMGNCSQTWSGNPTDADSDSFPVNLTYQFNCQGGYQNYTWTYKGKISVRDDSDTDPLSGFDIITGTFPHNRSPMTWTYSDGTNQVTVYWTFDFDLDLVGSDYQFTTWYGKWYWDPYYAEWDFSNTTFTPKQDNDNDPWNNGTYAGTGTITYNDSQQQNSFTIQYDFSQGLHYSETCMGFDSGNLTISFTCPGTQNTATYDFSYTSCNTGTISYQDCDGNSNTITF